MSTFYRLFYFVISTFFPMHLFFYKEQVYKQLPLGWKLLSNFESSALFH